MKYSNKGSLCFSTLINSSDKERNKAQFFENSEWLTTKEVAVYLRKFKVDGTPSLGAIRNMVYRGQLRPHKLYRRLYFRKAEIERLLMDAA